MKTFFKISILYLLFLNTLNAIETLNSTNFDTNLELLENLELKTNNCLANSFYINEDKYIITDDYHKKICTFNKNGYIEKCLEKK
ncbi:hypothetical protein L5F09_02495 [Aliarcobacter butzleri]|uniref:hypothetical protein n=1 Tax=Aliarcobacter butzleri TaxID=28197 RepID=UPI001EDA6A09|nr:hypothetical protein [Aliarcobacter butzleri]MCG3664611.1 hypothetical protein [Aliarcobacter butzleri]